MKYLITAMCHGEKCEQTIEELKDGLALLHYNNILARQPSHINYSDYKDWKLERMPVEGKLLAEGDKVYE